MNIFIRRNKLTISNLYQKLFKKIYLDNIEQKKKKHSLSEAVKECRSIFRSKITLFLFNFLLFLYARVSVQTYILTLILFYNSWNPASTHTSLPSERVSEEMSHSLVKKKNIVVIKLKYNALLRRWKRKNFTIFSFPLRRLALLRCWIFQWRLRNDDVFARVLITIPAFLDIFCCKQRRWDAPGRRLFP